MAPPSAKTSLPLFEIALLLLLATLWASAYTFIKIGVETIPPITFIATRTTLAGGLLYLILRLRGLRMPTDRAIWRRFLIQASLNSAVPFTLIAWAEQSIDAGLATILNSMTPVFVLLLNWIWFKHEPTTGRKFLGVGLGLAGTCLIVGVEALNGLGREVLAQSAVILAAIFYGCAAIFGKNFKGIDPMATAAGSMLCGAAILIPFSIVIDRPWTLRPSPDSLLALLALAVFSTALAFTIYFRLLHSLGSVSATSQAFLRVPIGVAIGVIFLGETVTPTMGIGLICVVLGVACITLPGRRSMKKDPALRPDPFSSRT